MLTPLPARDLPHQHHRAMGSWAQSPDGKMSALMAQAANIAIKELSPPPHLRFGPAVWQTIHSDVLHLHQDHLVSIVDRPVLHSHPDRLPAVSRMKLTEASLPSSGLEYPCLQLADAPITDLPHPSSTSCQRCCTIGLLHHAIDPALTPSVCAASSAANDSFCR